MTPLVKCSACRGTGKHPGEFPCMKCSATGRTIDPGLNRIRITFVNREDQPYDTLDYYEQVGDLLSLKITATGNHLYDQFLLIHALIERLIANARGISDDHITQFDLAYKGTGEPGEDPAAPYRDAHLCAKGIEMILCAQLGIPWQEYESALERLFGDGG